MKSREFKVLVNYNRNGVFVSRSIYTGPHKKHADKAFFEACVLGLHGVMTDCTIRFFDGFRLRQDSPYGFKTFPVPADGAATPGPRETEEK